MGLVMGTRGIPSGRLLAYVDKMCSGILRRNRNRYKGGRKIHPKVQEWKPV